MKPRSLAVVVLALLVLSALSAAPGSARALPSPNAAAPPAYEDFAESGLPADTHWTIDLNGASLTSNDSVIDTAGPGTSCGAITAAFCLPNGTYLVQFPPTDGYVVSPSTSSSAMTEEWLTVAGPTLVTVAFVPVATTTTLSFNESGLPYGDTWEVTLDSIQFTSGTEGPGGGSNLTVVVGAGPWSYSIGIPKACYGASEYCPDVPFGSTGATGFAVVGAQPLNLSVPFFSVTVNQTGLNGTTPFNATIGNETINGTPSGGERAFVHVPEFSGLPNGVYPYHGSPVAGFVAPAGTVRIHGQDLVLTLVYVPPGQLHTYSVKLHEDTLARRTRGGATLDGVLSCTTTGALTFSTVAPGDHWFQVGGVPGKIPTVPFGEILVVGHSVSRGVEFVKAKFSVSFAETGLQENANGKVPSWSARIGGHAGSTRQGSLTFQVANGTYTYRVAAPMGYAGTVTGSETVDGASIVLTVHFVRI